MGENQIKPLNYWLIKLIILLILLSVVSGCWDARELTTLAMVTAVGIDLDEKSGKILMTVQIVKPGEVKSSSSGDQSSGGGTSGKAGGGQPVWIINITGSNVAEAVRNFATISDRQLYFAHNQLIVIGKEAAKQGVRPLLDFFIRSRDPRETAWIVVAVGKASEVIEAKSGLEKIPAMGTTLLVESYPLTSVTVGVTLKDFVNRLMSKTAAPYAGHITLIEESGANTVRAVGIDVFKGDKFKGTFNQSETRGLLWVSGKVKRGLITVVSPKGGKTNFEITRASSRVTPELKGNQIRFKVQVMVESNLGSEDYSLDFTKPQVLKGLEKLETEAIRQEVAVALAKARKLNTDIFGFGEAIHRQFPKEWKLLEPQWDTLFPKIKVTLAIRTKIRTVGLALKPPAPPKGP